MSGIPRIRAGAAILVGALVVAAIVGTYALRADETVRLEAGMLIRSTVQPSVYYYAADGKRYVFPNEATYFTWYRDFASVRWINDVDLARIPLGGNVTYRPGAKMVKVVSAPQVYAVDRGGTLRWVTSESVAVALYGPTWQQRVDDLPDAFFVNYRTGAPIQSANDFNPRAAAELAATIGADLQRPAATTEAPRGVPREERPATSPETRPTEPSRESVPPGEQRPVIPTPPSAPASEAPRTETAPGEQPASTPAAAPLSVPADFTIAFIGDQGIQGLHPDAAAVLQLVKREGTDLVLHQGDFDYVDDPDRWEAMVDRELGANFPYLASIGDHDVTKWSQYRAKLLARLGRMPGATCTGDYGIRSTCTYQGITIVMASGYHVGTGTQDPAYIRSALGAATTPWRICSTHQSLRHIDQLIQLYDECRKGGAIVAGAHEHLYVRSHLVSDFVRKTIADRGSTLTVGLGQTVAFISGLAGKSVDDLRDGLYVPRDWWAKRYTRAEQARSGALFCTFNPGGNAPNRANCTFKDIAGNVADSFTLVTNIAAGSTAASPPASPPLATLPAEVPPSTPAASGTATPVKVAFIGDETIGPSAIPVLQLIVRERADAMVHLGDFDYVHNPAGWETMINRYLGASFPVFGVVGNHDVADWPQYQQQLLARAARVSGASCTGDYGVNSTCTFRGISFLLSGVGSHGQGHVNYLQSALPGSSTPWKVCAWHAPELHSREIRQSADVCRTSGAPIMTGHIHAYSRTPPALDFAAKRYGPASDTTFDLGSGETVLVVSGLGGGSIRDETERQARAAIQFAPPYAADYVRTHGSLFCTFNAGGDANRASCEFKAIDGTVVDSFIMVRGTSSAPGTTPAPVNPTPSPAPTPTPSPIPAPAPPPPATPGPGGGVRSSVLGTNLAEHRDWSGAWMFTNIFKMARPWIAGEVGGCWQCGVRLDLDANRWVRSLAANAGSGKPQAANTVIFSGTGNRFPAGQYVVYYDGEGTITYTIPKDPSSRPGRDALNFSGATGAGFNLSITATDPRGTGNYIRNIRVMMPGGACTNDPAQYCTASSQCGGSGSCELFADNPDRIQLHPNFLANVQPFSIIRYMDLMGTNHAPFVRYQDYAQLAYAQWPESPAEAICQISNETQTDPWVTIPHKFDDAAVRSFAQTLAGCLGASRKVYIEYSNEVWNPGFSQITEVAIRGCQRNPALQAACDQDATPGNGQYCEGFPGRWNPTCRTGYIQYFSERSVEIWDIFEQVFGGTSRLVRVMGSQIGQASLHRELLSWKNAHQKTDALATAPYVGGEIGGNAAAISWSPNQLFQELTTVSLPLAFSRIDVDANFLRTSYPRIALFAYEGGQHLVGLSRPDPTSGTPPKPLRENVQMTNLFVAANRDPRMGALYDQYLSGLLARGVQKFVHFNNVGRWTKYGSWGAKENEDQSDAQFPKRMSILNFARQHP